MGYLRTFALITLAASSIASAQIRKVDFKNHFYPLSSERLGHDTLEWMNTATKRHIKLKNGENRNGFALDSVDYADVSGDGKDSAIVVVHFSSGGTEQLDYVYIYSSAGTHLKLLAYFHTGDRAYSGLHNVYGQNGQLVIELSDPDKATANCCSSGYVRTRYRWTGQRFKPSGAREFGEIKIEER